jgi:hypothetical protein
MAARSSTLALSALLGFAAGPAGPALAQGAGSCADAVAGWGETAARENSGGFMGDSVYKRVQDEIARADGLCRAGQDAQARRAVAESKRRHGY